MCRGVAACVQHQGELTGKLIDNVPPADDNRSTPFVVGVSGHRDLSPDALPKVRSAVTEFLRQLRAHLPDTELRIMTGMATGADQLVAQVALDLGIEVDAVLPMPLQQYAEDFDAPSLQTLEALLGHPGVRRTELSLPSTEEGGPAHRDALYSNLTQTLIRTCNLLLAVWDGESSVLPGGTADTVLRFLEVRADHGGQQDRVLFADAPAEEDPPLRLVFWVPAARIGSDPGVSLKQPCFLSGLGENVLQRWPGMPFQLREQLDQLNTYNREYQHLVRSGTRGAPDSLMSTLSPSVSVPGWVRPTLEQIDAQYGKADALAMFFQRRSDRLFTFFSVTAFAMGCAFLAYEKFVEVRALLLLYLAILLSGFGLYYLLHGRRWFAKHLMCRALAETLRAKFYLCLAGADHLVDAEEVVSLSGIDRFHGFGWIVHVLTSFETPATRAGADRELRGSSAAVETGWIESQRQYFISKVARLERSSRRTSRLKRSLFVVILLVILSLILLGDSAHAIRLAFDIPLKNVLTFTMGLLAVTLGVWELHQNKMATRELLWQYRNQLNHFSRAHTQLARTSTETRRRQILAALGKDSLMESYLWTIHRYHREHEPPGRG
jgi:hypothetical protein